MKIIALKFMNINSLKGEQRISFEDVPLSDASIFAIVGPTGSGKSTILDVITLALFNRIPRFSKAISTNEITKESSVLTHHTKEAYASIEYEVKGNRYKSRWSIKTNRNDKLKDYEMTFYHPDGSVADLKKSEVPSKNEEIIGLNYDQFVKAILLSQGEFSKFLKSDKNERGALLENLTGTGIYRKIGRKTYEKHKEVKQALEDQKALLGEHKTLTEEERSNLESELKKATQKKAEEDSQLEKLQALLKVKQDIQRLSGLEVAKTEALANLKEKDTAFQPSELRIKTHQKLSHLQGPYANYKSAKINAEKSKVNLDNYKQELAETRKALQATIQEMATLTGVAVTQENFKKEMSAFEKEINDLDKDIKHLKLQGQDTRVRINQDKANYPLSLAESIKPQEAIDILNKRKEELEEVIQKSSIGGSQSLSQVKTEVKSAQAEIENLKSLDQHVTLLQKAEQKLIEDNNQLKSYKETEEKYMPLIGKTKDLLQAKKTEIDLLRKQKEDALKIAELEELRKTLVNGEACPLCGSKEHPYTEHLPEKVQSKIEQSIAEAERLSLEYQKEWNEYTTIVDKNKASMELVHKMITEATQLIEEGKQTTDKILAKIENSKSIDLQNLGLVIEERVASINLIEESIEAQSELEFNQRLASQYQELAQIGDRYRILLSERKEKFSGENISTIANTLQDAFAASETRINGLESVINNETKSLKRDEDLVEKLSKELAPKTIALGFASIEEIESQLLDEQTLETLTTQQERLRTEMIRVNSELKVVANDLKEAKKQDTDTTLEIEKLQSVITAKKIQADEQLRIASTSQERLKRDKEDQERLQSRQKHIDKLQAEFGKWSLLNKMIGSATGNDFANFAQGMTLKNLLVYANRRLLNLSDRYLLSKPENDGALIVIDKYQGNITRSVTTLSGGESFLISLALALSLSDMASKNVALGCLFIDEGFGTLDPDTLELAMTTLETLQSESQKTVGVISHVEALKERIDVQIQLDRNAQGLSTIKVVG